MLCSLTACLAGLAYESRLGSIGSNVDGGTLVLFGVAAAVIGGTSLFGGAARRPCAAVTVDALARRRASPTGV